MGWKSSSIGLSGLTGLLLLVFGCTPDAWKHGEVALAFTSDRSGECCRIYVAPADGAHPQELSIMKAHSPAWSPDGTQLAFVHWTKGTSGGDSDQEIYVMDSDGTNPRRLTHNSVRDDDPSWSPDGRSIAFVRGPEGSSDIYMVGVDDQTDQRLTELNGDVLDPAWAPTGRRITFVEQAGGWSSLYLLDADGDSQRLITKIPSTISSPTWSPDGRWIAFTQGKSIYRVGANGRGLDRLLRKDQWLHDTAWSPDGTEIAFVSVLNGFFVGPGFWEISAVDVATRKTREITNASGDFEPAWRPAGK